MEKRIITATKHKSKRNGSKTSIYWSISEDIDDIKIEDDMGYLREDIINLHWAQSELPKKVKETLETSDTDETGWSLKQSKFEISIEEIDEYGNFEFSDIIEIKKI